MRLTYTADQADLLNRAETYFCAQMNPGVRAALAAEARCGPTTRALRTAFGRDGWLGVGWSADLGGRGGELHEEHIIFDAGYRAGAPLPFLALKTVAPTLKQFGSSELCAELLPPIIAGEVEWAIGYSESEAGSDLASLQTRAVREGDSYVITGAKAYTSGGDSADYIWLAARTGSAADVHHNLSVFIVPTDSSGFSALPLPVMTGDHTALTYFEQVRIPAALRVGEEGQGWEIITSQLNRERVGIANRSSSWARQLLEDVAEWACEPRGHDGIRQSDQGWIRERLAESWALVETATIAGWRAIDSLLQETLTPAEASSVKVLATEMHQDVCRLLLDVVGLAGTLTSGSPQAVLRGQLEAQYRRSTLYTFGGGANEIQRQIIARHGLGLAQVAP